MLACLCSTADHIKKPIVAEVLALSRAAVLCAELGLQDLILEGNAQLVLKATNSGEETWVEHGNIIKDVRMLMTQK